MNTIIFLIIEITLLVLNLLLFIRFTNKKNINIILFFLLNVFVTYGIGEIFNKIHQVLRDRKIYIETGHSSLLEVFILLVFFIISTIVMMFKLFRKK